MDPSERLAHNQYQRRYFDHVSRARLALGETTYVNAHLARMQAGVPLQPGQTVLEVGAGPGKFTLPLAERGWDIVANDLSPVLLDQLRQASDQRVRTVCGDIAEVSELTDERFDHAVGFFVLHHLKDFDRVFKGLAKALKPGATVSFCEPVGWNPLYYLQILLTPSMRFAGEPSLSAMRPSVILPALARAGFVDTRAVGYGYFPPQLKNRPWGDRLEQWLDRREWVPFPHAFQHFSARLPG
ncbi:class I SAM-dependent methyltransferase [Hydrogenophaga pseudoflava]|uniref:class I SAM-dependent methyltransferase n=1 Tax=Hydrogenophaga pseudoflava TaxID=47421 RepID=UPI0027E5649D|nr:class I SAM-dependent methyltransferase [Hydrogenophaga pseudoflava]MDQ7743546.1 class I SAM-dependent methyltransferase [Hydrogenophaga pseudoflava]